MGLDMYLYESGMRTGRGVKGPLHITREKAYWRKANQIHQWFVANIQDYESDMCNVVYYEQLQKLVSVCKKVCAVLDKYSTDGETGVYILDNIQKEDERVLETFPADEIGTRYYDDLVSTIEQLESISEDNKYEYYASC